MLSAVFFGLMAFCSKLAMRSFDGATVAAMRFAVGFGLAALALRTVYRVAPTRRPWLLGLRGLLGGVAVLLYFLTIEHLSVGLASLLNYTSPIFTVFVARVALGERLPLAGFGALGLGVVGVTLVVAGQPGGIGSGAVPILWVGVGLASAVVSAFAVTTIRALRTGAERESALRIFLVFCGVGLLCSAPFGRSFRVPTPSEGALLVLVGVLAMVAQLLMNAMLRYVAAAWFGITAQLAVVTSMSLGVVFLDEPWTAMSGAGALLALLGVGWGARLATHDPTDRGS